ncbi:MAG: LysR substrate-binding domain-containing protein, partial [Sedimenticolaceae bacterium]
RGSFNEAAVELFVTPSAISHQVKSLEAYLGVSLFRRARRQVHLTIAGERYLKSVSHALDEIDLATRRLLASANAGAVNISVAPAFLTRWLVPKVREFQDRHPDIELRLSPNSGVIDFGWSDIDMAIYFGDGKWPGVELFFLREVVLVPVCSPAYVEANPPMTAPDDLCAHTLIDVSTRPAEWNEFLASFGVTRQKSGKRLSFSSTSLALGAAMESLGIALADRQVVAREVLYGRLVTPVDIAMENHLGYYLVYQKDRRLTDEMRAFLDWVMDEVAGESAGVD